MSQEEEDPKKKIDQEFLLELGLDESDVKEELFVLHKNKVRNVAALLTFPSEDRLRNLKAENEQGKEAKLGEGTIGLLWKYIAQNTAKSSRYINPLPIVQQLVGPDLPTAPPLTDLDTRVKRPLPAVYPVPRVFIDKCHEVFKRHANLSQDQGNTFSFLKASATELLDPEHFNPEPLVFDWVDMVRGQSEDCLHAVITPLIQRPLNWVFKTLGVSSTVSWSFGRNVTEPKRSRTSLAGKRPDWLLYLNNILVFRGEEKAQSSFESVHVATNELTQKMNAWNPIFFGNLEYVFGYALAGRLFQLYALHPDESIQHPDEEICGVRLTKIGAPLDLEQINHRCELVQYMFNLAKVFMAMIPKLPVDGPYLEQVDPHWKRNGSGDYSQLVFFPRYVRKKLISRPPIIYSFDVLSSLYAKVRGNIIRNTIKCEEGYPQRDSEDNIILHLYPIGKMDRTPRTDRELRELAIDLLIALETLHSAGFCHRDVRWPNVIQKTDGRWLLIDLDFCAQLNEDGYSPWPTWDRGVPNRRDQELWTCAHDLDQLCRMIADLTGMASASLIIGAISQRRNAKTAREYLEQTFGI